MIRDERFYAFIIARTSRSRSRIRRISIHKRWLKASAVGATLVFCAAFYGVYGIVRQATHVRVEQENERLHLENEKQRHQLDQLKNRVDAIENASRRLSEMSGVAHEEEEGTSTHGQGGPAMNLNDTEVAAVEARAAHIEDDLLKYEAALRERARVPSIWPVEGELTDGFGSRRNPFGYSSSEFHMGQDIAAQRGMPVVAAADGVVSFAGQQNGYGQIVIVDHGNGITTRYGHLSKIESTEGQEIRRGAELGQVGSTGRSTGPHLHYEVRINEEAVNPAGYLPGH